MSIKRILVHMDSGEENQIKLETAINLAKHYNATVSAAMIHTIGEQMLVSALASPPAFIDVSNIHDRNTESHYVQENMARTKKLVARLERLHQFPIKFQTFTGESKHILAEKSHCFDLLIVSSTMEEGNQLRQISVPSNSLATKSGCPILILPEGAEWIDSFKKPMVAWNGTPESARAISDSMPFLSDADDVSIINLRKTHGTFTSRGELNDELIDYLRLHKIDAKLVSNQKGKTLKIEDDVNQVLRQQNADLLVLGAYGHSQLRELFFHSQTKEILDNAKVPVLLSR